MSYSTTTQHVPAFAQSSERPLHFGTQGYPQPQPPCQTASHPLPPAPTSATSVPQPHYQYVPPSGFAHNMPNSFASGPAVNETASQPFLQKPNLVRKPFSIEETASRHPGIRRDKVSLRTLVICPPVALIGLILVSIGAHGAVHDTIPINLCDIGADCSSPSYIGDGMLYPSVNGGHIGELAMGAVMLVLSFIVGVTTVGLRRKRGYW